VEFNIYLILASLAAFCVGLSKGGLSSIGMLGVPLLSLVMSPVKAAVLLLPIFVVSDMVGIWLYRKSFDVANLKILVPAGLLGIFLGWLTASVVSDTAVKLLIGLIGLSFCLNMWLRKNQAIAQQPAHRLKGTFWGALSGFTSFISHSGAPPYQVYMLPQQLPKIQFAGTTTLFFAVVNAAKIIPYQNLRPYSYDDLISSALLIPAALIGTFAGAYLTKRISDVWFFRFIQWGLFMLSIKLTVDAMRELLV
jgi:uncharacterized membrane protein YfcA